MHFGARGAPYSVHHDPMPANIEALNIYGCEYLQESKLIELRKLEEKVRAQSQVIDCVFVLSDFCYVILHSAEAPSDCRMFESFRYASRKIDGLCNACEQFRMAALLNAASHTWAHGTRSLNYFQS